MNDFISGSAYFGITVSLASYGIGVLINKKTGKAFMNPLLISVIITIAFLAVCHIDFDVYNSGAKFLSWLLTPATVCLAIPLYDKLSFLKSDWKAIFAGIISGVIASLGCILAMAAAFGLSHEEYVSFLPKSITTAIGIGVSEELGGYQELTVASIIITGVLGNVTAPLLCRLFRIKEPVAVGIAIGTSSHAVGTARAMEIGDTEGAMSSLSIAVSGLLTVVGASVFASLH